MTFPAGLVVDREGVATIVAGIDVEPVLLTRGHADGAAWEPHELVTGRAVFGELAGRTALLVRMDPFTMAQEILVVADGRAEVVAAGCDLAVFGSSHLLSPDVVTYMCGGDRTVARRGPSGWTVVATLPRVLVDGAVGDDGTVYLLDTNLAQPTSFWMIQDGVVTESTADCVGTVGDVGFCGGQLFATFEQPYDRGSLPALGTWRDGAWQLETIAGDVAGSGALAFDEACHPFVALGDLVYSRGPDGWTASSIGMDGSVHDLAAFDGRIYATYESITDSSHAFLAWAHLAPSR